jgi:hypothetical protein
MSGTLAHPFRIDSNGAAVTLEQGSLTRFDVMTAASQHSDRDAEV